MFAGGLIHGLYLGGIFFAVRHGLSAGLAALIAGLQPLVTTLLAARFLGEPSGRAIGSASRSASSASGW